MGDWVLVDTCIWASFFAKPSSPEKAGVNKLLKADRAAIIGPIAPRYSRDSNATIRRIGWHHGCGLLIACLLNGMIGARLLDSDANVLR